jgi:hypothetical protein
VRWLTNQDKLERRLREHGEDAMRRDWNDAYKRGILFDPSRRHHYLAEVERIAADQRPERMRWLRENLGEREAEFRQGRAQEAAYLLRNPPVKHSMTRAQKLESKLHQAFLDRPYGPESDAMTFEQFKARHKRTKHTRAR